MLRRHVPGLLLVRRHLVAIVEERLVDPLESRVLVILGDELGYTPGTIGHRDVGSPPRDGRALALRVRDSWQARRDRPYLRAAGTWIAKAGVLPATIDVAVADALAVAVVQCAEDLVHVVAHVKVCELLVQHPEVCVVGVHPFHHLPQ